MPLGGALRGGLLRPGGARPQGIPVLDPARAPRGLIFCAPLFSGFFGNVASGPFPALPVRTGTNPYTANADGGGLLLNGTTQCLGFAYQQQPPQTWSMEAIERSVNPTAAGSLCGWNSAANGTGSSWDRTIQSPSGASSSASWQGYLFDGGQKFTPASGSFSSGVRNHIIVTCDAGSGTGKFSIYINGVLSGTPTAVSNGGYTGYTLPVYFCLGFAESASGFVPNSFNSTALALVNFANVAWTASEVLARFADPYAGLTFPSDQAWSWAGSTAVVSPVGFDFDWNPQTPVRRKPRLYQADAPAEEWPFTAVNTPTQVGWDNPPQFVRRSRASNHPIDELVAFPATTQTAIGFDFDWNPQFPIRRRAGPYHLDESVGPWPFTAIATPTQFAWEIPPQFARRAKGVLHPGDDSPIIIPPPPAVTPTTFGWDWPPQFPIRRKPRLYQFDQPPDLWPLTNIAVGNSGRPSPISPVAANLPQSSWAQWLKDIAAKLNLVLGGKINATTAVTLAPNANSTMFIDSRIGAFSYVALMPNTYNAAEALINLDSPIYITTTKGSATIYHVSSPNTDMIFTVLIIS